MNFLSFFRSSTQKQIQKARKKVKEPHGDPATRISAAQKLRNIGTSDAIFALLDRFTIDVSPSNRDEQEKVEVLGWLVTMGKDAVISLSKFLKNERQVYWPARALREIVSEEEFAYKLEEILRYHWENPPASPDPTAQLIRLLGKVRAPKLVETVKMFLDDEDDDVRLSAISYLFQFPNKEEGTREAILECYLDSEDRPRLRNNILECLVESNWNVRGYRPRIEETLPDGYVLTREGKVRPLKRSGFSS